MIFQLKSGLITFRTWSMYHIQLKMEFLKVVFFLWESKDGSECEKKKSLFLKREALQSQKKQSSNMAMLF